MFTRGRRIYCNPHQNLTFYVPDGVTKIFAFVLGAGGGGMAREVGYNGDDYCATGGAGGGYASGIISVSPGASITCTVGQGGRGKSSSDNNTAGGTTSFGSYLTGNGGAAGINHSSFGSNWNYATKSGGGGTASTSGVSQAVTFSGGGTSPGYTNTTSVYAYRGGAGGGASSGSPWGPGTSKPQIGALEGAGGAGWGSNMNQSVSCRGFMSSSNSAKWNATPGDGSAQAASIFNVKYNNQNNGTSNGKGGNGITARGGMYYLQSGQNIREQTNAVSALASDDDSGINGENGNPNWWFPWDIDGGGGGSRCMNEANQYGRYDVNVRGGDGGPGAGGGAVSSKDDNQTYSYSVGYGYQSRGGDGGIGGGGGANFSFTPGTGARPTGRVAGNGGFGGGGGGLYTYNSNDRGGNSTYQAGNGGNGLIIVYW